MNLSRLVGSILSLGQMLLCQALVDPLLKPRYTAETTRSYFGILDPLTSPLFILCIYSTKVTLDIRTGLFQWDAVGMWYTGKIKAHLDETELEIDLISIPQTVNLQCKINCLIFWKEFLCPPFLYLFCFVYVATVLCSEIHFSFVTLWPHSVLV